VDMSYGATTKPGVEATVEEEGGKTKVKFGNMGFRFPQGWNRWSGGVHWLKVEHWWERVGIFVRWKNLTPMVGLAGGYSGVYVSVPYWLFCVLSGLWPGVWVWSRWRRGRFGPGMCGKCGYDMRATPGRCPECGVEFQS
jgi:hypothetical protein